MKLTLDEKLDITASIMRGSKDLNSMTVEDYIKLKESRVSDDCLIEYFDIKQSTLTGYKHLNGLIGVKIAGFGDGLSSYKEEIQLPDNEYPNKEDYAKRYRLPPVDASNMDFHIALADAESHARDLEKEIVELKEMHKLEVQHQAACLAAQNKEIAALHELLDKDKPDKAENLDYLSNEFDRLQQNNQEQLSHIRILEAEIHSLKEELMFHVTIQATELKHSDKMLNASKKVIKQLAKLI